MSDEPVELKLTVGKRSLWIVGSILGVLFLWEIVLAPLYLDWMIYRNVRIGAQAFVDEMGDELEEDFTERFIEGNTKSAKAYFDKEGNPYSIFW